MANFQHYITNNLLLRPQIIPLIFEKYTLTSLYTKYNWQEQITSIDGRTLSSLIP